MPIFMPECILLCGIGGFVRHSFFFGVVTEDFFGDAIFLDAPAQAVLDLVGGLVQVEPCADDEPFRVVNPDDKVNLFLSAVFHSHERTKFHVALP